MDFKRESKQTKTMSDTDSDGSFAINPIDVSLSSSDDADGVFYCRPHNKSTGENKIIEYSDDDASVVEDIENSSCRGRHESLEQKLDRLSKRKREVLPHLCPSSSDEDMISSMKVSMKSTVDHVGLLLSTDEDEDEDSDVSFIIKNSEVADALMKAKMAQAELFKAQRHHDQERKTIDVDVMSGNEEDLVSQVLPANSGPQIGIKLRTQIRVAPDSYEHVKSVLHGNTIILHIGLYQQLHYLMNKYRDTHQPMISSTSSIRFHFDGEIMNLDSTPFCYEIEDEDLIDVVVDLSDEITTPSVVKNDLNNVKGKDERIKIKTCVKGGNPKISHIYQLRLTDPFRKITNVYRKKHGYSSVKPLHLQYDGTRLNLDDVPTDHGMDDGVLIEIIDETERQRQFERMTLFSSSSVKGDV